MFKVTVPITKYEEVKVDPSQIKLQLLSFLLGKLKPQSAKGYDSWYINTCNNKVVGVTEYYHGSDSNTHLEEADSELLEKYKAVHVVMNML